MTDEIKKRHFQTVRERFPELLQYWDTECNNSIGVTPDNVMASGRVTVNLICPNCGRRYMRKLNNAYSVHKKNGSYDGYCAACRPRTVHEYTTVESCKPKDYELLGFYPALLPFFDFEDKRNKYARMPTDARFIKVHLGKKYVWKFKGNALIATIEDMISKVKS